MDYELKIYKNLNVVDSKGSWCNTHEFTTDAAIDTEAMKTHVMQLVDFEKEFHLPGVQFIRAVLRVWEEETDGYNPLELRTFTLEGAGTLPPPTPPYDIYDLNFAIDVVRDATLGRTGHLYYRGCVAESMVGTTSRGDVSLTEDGRTLIAAQVGQASPNYFGTDRVMVLRGKVRKTGDIVRRPVTGFHVGALVLSPRDHKFFHKGWRRGTGPTDGITPPEGE